MPKKTIILFSGGKDSFYSLIEICEVESIEYIVIIKSPTGDTQLHAGPEVDEKLREAQIKLLELSYKEIIIGSDKKYLRELFLQLNNLVQQDSITHLVTGDLWHPYTSGIGEMLAGALGVELIRPTREICQTKNDGIKCLTKILSKGITPLIISVRQGDLPENFVGREINEQFINELISKNTDIMAEGGEYQSFVVSAPNMKGKIVIDDFDIRLVVGKNGKEKFYRMFVNKFHVEK